eukprot:3353981-Rhodomonas_salina.1
MSGNDVDPSKIYQSKEDMLLHKMYIRMGISPEQCDEILSTLKMDGNFDTSKISTTKVKDLTQALL